MSKILEGQKLSIRDDIQGVKQEFDTEEKMIENYIKGERFFKKYKRVFIYVGLSLLMGGIGYTGFNIWQDNVIEESNIAYNRLIKNPNDKNALEMLKNNNEVLYNHYLFSQAMKNSDTNILNSIALKNSPIISDISKFQLASISKDINKIKEYQANKSGIYKELAIILEAGYHIEHRDSKSAIDTLSRIPVESPLKEIAINLEHLTIKGLK
jgi:hypothetical protein